MCGLTGIIGFEDINIFKRLHLESENRGYDSSGIVIIKENSLFHIKDSLKTSELWNSKKLKDFLKLINKDHVKFDKKTFFLGHSRMETNGFSIFQQNNQPIIENNTMVMHNGILTDNPEHTDYTLSDTRLICKQISSYFNKKFFDFENFNNYFKSLKGYHSLIFTNTLSSELYLISNNKNIWYYHNDEKKIFCFTSELKFFESIDQYVLKDKVVNLQPYQLIKIDLENVSLTKDISLQKDKLYKKKLNFFINKPVIKRCSKCILPHTYPMIKFDKNGVCNFCNNYKRQDFLGENKLDEILSQVRSKNGNVDCVVGLSGGRDSSYGLHMLKKVFNMNPIAYTYDWGLISDNCRRNISRICGKLNIEHILRASDTQRQRNFVKANISGWMSRPVLGMIPIFMAPDKKFLYHFNRVINENSVKLGVFCTGHQLEQREFLIGFTGINQKLENNQNMYKYELINKLKLFFWYSKEFLLNYKYINKFMFDNLLSFYYSFFFKTNDIYLYNYLKFDERKVEELLVKEYNYEFDSKFGTSQWRQGDLHVAFMNYVFLEVAGFTEKDNYRSNQIREGYLDRQQALEKIDADNYVNPLLIKEFCDVININFYDVLKKIQKIDKRYNYELVKTI